MTGKEYYRKGLQNIIQMMMKIFLEQALLLVNISVQE